MYISCLAQGNIGQALLSAITYQMALTPTGLVFSFFIVEAELNRRAAWAVGVQREIHGD